MIEYTRSLYKPSISITINGVSGGKLEPKEDGFWDWYPELRPGYIPAYVLKSILDKLNELNEEWENIMANNPPG